MLLPSPSSPAPHPLEVCRARGSQLKGGWPRAPSQGCAPRGCQGEGSRNWRSMGAQAGTSVSSSRAEASPRPSPSPALGGGAGRLLAASAFQFSDGPRRRSSGNHSSASSRVRTVLTGPPRRQPQATGRRPRQERRAVSPKTPHGPPRRGGGPRLAPCAPAPASGRLIGACQQPAHRP